MTPWIKAAAEKMLIDFETTKIIAHNLTKGEAREASFIVNFLRPYLPNRFSVASGLVIDINGKASKQQDVVIYDQFNSPILADLEDNRLFFPESVHCTIEVKSVLKSNAVEDMVAKSASVWALESTALPEVILSPGFAMSANRLPPICMGIAFESEFATESIIPILRQLRTDEPSSYALSCICVLRTTDGRAALIFNVSERNLAQTQLVPSRSSRLAYVTHETAGDALMQMYLMLMEYLRMAGTMNPGPNLMEYASRGLDISPQIKIPRDEMQGAQIMVEGALTNVDMLDKLRTLSLRWTTGEATDEERIELFRIQVEQNPAIVDDRAKIYVNDCTDPIELDTKGWCAN